MFCACYFTSWCFISAYVSNCSVSVSSFPFLMTSGCKSGIGRGRLLSSGLSGGGGHGGKGGNGVVNGSRAEGAEGGPTYGNADLPCELGSGSGNDSTGLSTAGGGIIGNTYIHG